MHGAFAGDVNNKHKLIGLLDFIYTVIGGNVFAIILLENITADELTTCTKILSTFRCPLDD